LSATAALTAETTAAVAAAEAMAVSDNDDRGQDGDHDDDVVASSSCYYHPSFCSADPPAPSLPGVAVGGGRAAHGSDGDDQDDVAVLPRWRLDAGNANAHGADAVAGGGGNR
jgi:hypothetical protein